MSTWTGQSQLRMLWATTSWCAAQRLQSVPHHLLADLHSLQPVQLVHSVTAVQSRHPAVVNSGLWNGGLTVDRWQSVTVVSCPSTRAKISSKGIEVTCQHITTN